MIWYPSIDGSAFNIDTYMIFNAAVTWMRSRYLGILWWGFASRSVRLNRSHLFGTKLVMLILTFTKLVIPMLIFSKLVIPMLVSWIFELFSHYCESFARRGQYRMSSNKLIRPFLSSMNEYSLKLWLHMIWYDSWNRQRGLTRSKKSKKVKKKRIGSLPLPPHLLQDYQINLIATFSSIFFLSKMKE